MEFNEENFTTIKEACEQRNEIDFWVEKSVTAFSDSSAPDDWTAYPPVTLPPKGYAEIFLFAGSDKKGELMKLELLVHLDGGRILYKKDGNDKVLLKITW